MRAKMKNGIRAGAVMAGLLAWMPIGLQAKGDGQDHDEKKTGKGNENWSYAGGEKDKRAVPVPDDLTLLKEIEYGKVGDRPLFLDVLKSKTRPAEKMPALVWIHGGGWWQGSKDGPHHVARMTPFARDGYICFIVGYRLTPEAPFPAQIQDVKCAIRFLRAKAEAFGIDPDRIGAWGGSAGGHLAGLLAVSGGVPEFEGNGGWQDQSSRVQAACCASGLYFLDRVYDDAENLGKKEKAEELFTHFAGGPPMEKEKREILRLANPARYLSRDDPPILLMHGDADESAPIVESRLFHEALVKAGLDARFVIVPGAGHAVGAEAIRENVPGFFARHLKSPASR